MRRLINMLEFYKNDTGIRLNVDELEELGDRDMLEVVVEVILALDEGFIEDQDVTFQDLIKMFKNPEDLDE
jgi:hypothetical protein